MWTLGRDHGRDVRMGLDARIQEMIRGLVGGVPTRMGSYVLSETGA